MNHFAARIAQLGKADTVDELHDVLQGCLYHPLTAADYGEAQDRALPKILIAALADRDVKLIRYARLDSFDDAALALERVILGQSKGELEDPDNHGPAH